MVKYKMALNLDKILVSILIPCSVCDEQAHFPIDGYSFKKTCDFCSGSGHVSSFISAVEFKSLLDGYQSDGYE